MIPKLLFFMKGRRRLIIHFSIVYWLCTSSSCRAASTDSPYPLSPCLLSFIASGRSSELYPISSHSCCMNVRAGHPAFDWPYAGVHCIIEEICHQISLFSRAFLLLIIIDHEFFSPTIYWSNKHRHTPNFFVRTYKLTNTIERLTFIITWGLLFTL